MGNIILIELIRELEVINGILMDTQNVVHRNYLLALRLNTLSSIWAIEPDFNATKGEAIIKAYGND